MSGGVLGRHYGQGEPINFLNNHSIPRRQRKLTDSRPKFSIDENLPCRFLPVSNLTYFMFSVLSGFFLMLIVLFVFIVICKSIM